MFHQIFALRAQTGVLVHADQDDVLSGLACDCVCSLCQGQLVAKKGDVRIHHFAHLGATGEGGGGCGYGARHGESDLAHFARAIVRELSVLSIPEIIGDFDAVQDRRIPARSVPIDRGSVEIQPALLLGSGESFKPDLRLASSGRPLIVEITIGGNIGSRKTAQLKRNKTAAIEIVLDPDRLRNTSLEYLKNAIQSGAPRRWIHHPKIEARLSRLKKESSFEKARHDQEMERFAALMEEAEEAVEAIARRRFVTDDIKAATDEIKRLKLDDLCGAATVGAAAVGSPTDIWQPLVLLMLLRAADKNTGAVSGDVMKRFYVRLRRVAPYPRGLDFSMKFPKLWEVRKDVPDFATTWHAIYEYLRWLTKAGEIKKMPDGYGFTLEQRLKTAVAGLKQSDAEFQEIRTLANGIMHAATQADAKRYDFTTWIDGIDPRYNQGLAQQVDPTLSGSLIDRLNTLADYLKKGYRYRDKGQAIDLVGLPLENTITGRKRRAKKDAAKVDAKRAQWQAIRTERAMSAAIDKIADELYAADLALLVPRIETALKLAPTLPALGENFLGTKAVKHAAWTLRDALKMPFGVGRMLLRAVSTAAPEVEAIRDPWPERPLEHGLVDGDADRYRDAAEIKVRSEVAASAV